jgi:hypothetical protein
MKTYTLFSDAGHGWIKVGMSELIRLGIADKISTYSYQYGENAYLEEDCDYSTWLNAKNECGEQFTIKNNNCNGYSQIRKYPHYSFKRYTNKPARIVGEVVKLGKAQYRLDYNQGRTGWQVTCMNSGISYRLPVTMLNLCERAL